MRCSYRHNMWCNCKKPIHHDVHVTGIGDPSVSEVTLQVSESISITFSYSPSNAPSPSSDILLGTDGDAVEVTSLNYADGLATMIIDGRIAGNATVWYQLGEDASTRKTISVTVPQPEPFSPTNSIYVTKDTPGEAIQTKSKKSKKTLATAVGETYQARIFAVNSSSANYVLMEWIYGGDASITAWVGNTYNEYTTNLFNDQAVLNKIAREIESYDDRHLLGDNVTKFTDATWTRMENYFDTEFSPELATQVQGYIIDNGGTRFVSPYFNPEISDTVGNDGEWITVRGWLPAEGGTFYTNPQNKLLMGNFQRVSSVDHNVEIQYRLLGTGTSIAGYESASGHRAEIEITSQDSGYIWPEFVTADNVSVTASQTSGYFFYYTPAEASIDDLSIYSGDTNVFTVSDKQGGGGAGYINITGQNEGSADLNITTLGGGVLAQPTITVTPFVHVETIGAPSVSDVTLNIGEDAYVNVPFTPANITDITQDVPLYIDNNNIATTWWVNVHEGTILIHGVSAGTTQVHYYLNSDPETIYTINVTVQGATPSYEVNEHTILYAPLTGNTNGTNSAGTIITPDVLGEGATISDNVAHFALNGALRYNIGETSTKPKTVSLWIRPSLINDWMVARFHENWTNAGVSIDNQFFATDVFGGGDFYFFGADEGWNLLTIVYDTVDNFATFYVNGQYQTNTNYNETFSTIDKIYLGARGYDGGATQAPWNGAVSDFIVEDIAWTQEQVANYFNASKAAHPFTSVESLSNLPNEITMAQSTESSYYINYSPESANRLDEQIRFEVLDTQVASISNKWQPGPGQYAFTVYGDSEGTTSLNVYLNDVLQATIPVTVTPFIHVESIGGPSVNSVNIMVGVNQYVEITNVVPSYVTNASRDITIYSDDPDIADSGLNSLSEPNLFVYGTGVGTTQVHYYLISDPETVYTVDVTVTAPEVHYNLYNNNEYSTEGSWNLNATNTTGYVLGDLQATEFNNGYMETYEVLNNALFGSKDFSMGTWVKLRSLPTGNDWISMLCTGEPNGNYNAVVGYSQGQVYLGGWQNDRATGYALNIGEWYHLVMTHSNGTAKLYVNGNLEYEANDVNFNIQSGHFVIGSNLTTDNQFVDGCMNEVFIANREYTAGEIATIYSNSAASHEEVVWVYFQSNDDAKGSLSLSQLQVPTGSPVVVSGNTVTIDGTTVTATPNSGNFFFGFTGAPSTISGDEYITANFFAEGETPTISYALGTVTSAVDKSISVPGYKVSQIEFSGTTNNMGTWGGIWMPVKAQDGNDWFGTYIQLGSNEGIYNSSFHNEIKKDGSMYRGLTAQNYGLGQTSTSFHSTLTKDVATYTYGEYSDTYTFSDHSGDYANWVKQLLARTDLIASVSPTNSSFENASIVVQYEPAVLVSELQNVPQSIAQTFNRTTTYNFDYLPINADIVDIEITSDNGNVQITDQRDDGNGVYSFSLYGAAEGQDSLNVYLNGSISTTIPVEVQGIHVDTLSGFLENSISLGEGGHKEVNLDITPNAVSDIGMDINLWSDDGSIAQAGFVDVSSGVVNITGISAGQTQVHASLTSDPGTVYDLDVTVEEATAEYNLYQNDGAETKGGYSPLIMQNTDYGDVAAQCTKFSGGNSAAYTQTMFDDSEPLQGDFSWVGWVRFEEGYDSETRVIFSKGDGGWVNDSNFSLVMLPSKNLQLSTGPGGMYSTQDFDEVPFTPVLKKWYHIGYTLNWSTNEINLYIDGQLVETWTPDIAPGTTGTQFMIGRYHNNRRGSFVGYMNEIMFTKKELSALEISDIYDAQASSHTNILPATISGPSENSISLEEYEGQNVTFSYTPNNVEIFSSLVISSTDDTIAKAELGPFSNGTAAINISGMGVGNATISYYLDSDPLTVYTISVTVTQSSSLYTPTQNTIAYFPFKGTVADFSGNEIPVGNNNWSEGNKGIIFSSGSAVELNSSDIKFVGMWYKASSDFLSDNSVEGILWYEKFGELSYSLSHSSPTRKDVICLWKGEGYTDAVTLGNMSYDEWHYFARGVDSNGDLLVVKDGSIYTAVENGTGYDFGSNFKALRGVLNNIEISDLIIDGATWDTQDIVNYYSATHSKYQTVMVTVTSVDDSQGSVDSNNIEAIEGDVGTISGNTITVSGTTVTATANPGFEFDHWEDGQGNVATGTFTVSVGMEFVAHFAQSNE